MRSRSLKGWWVMAALGAAMLSPSEAKACGGTFCDNGPVPMPVDQSGENILFVVDGEQTEAHVQIQYEGDPERFAWVVPMPSVPDVAVGSNQLFQNLLGGTAPLYSFTQSFDNVCGQNGILENGGRGDGASFGGSAGASGGPPQGPEVVLRKTVGVFDVVVLSGGTADEVTEWLLDNNYQTTADAPRLLAPYVDAGMVFAAIKLTAGVGLDEIHPIRFRYDGTQPMIPIQLTAVAATPDMGVRTFFLSRDRVVPLNYRHVVLNPARIDWVASGANYNTVVTNAADAEGADGHAFATEYAGPSDVISTTGIYSESWNPALFETIEPRLIVDELQVQGLADCSFGPCQFNHPLLLPILQEHLPRPAGVTDEDFYGCLSCYEDMIDLTAWDGVEFAADLDERIVQPGLRAQDLLARNPYLTRMFTTLSPEDMTVDPTFGEVQGLDDVGLPVFANQRFLCNGDSVMELPNGYEVALDGGSWPAFDDSMPWALRVEQFDGNGTRTLLTNNEAITDRELTRSNAGLGYRGAGDSGGCACSVPGSASSGSVPILLSALGIAGFGILRRRRRG